MKKHLFGDQHKMIRLFFICLSILAISVRGESLHTEFKLNWLIEEFALNKISSVENLEESLKNLPLKGLPRFQKLRLQDFRDKVNKNKNYLVLSASDLEKELETLVKRAEPGIGTKNIQIFSSLTWISTVARRNSILGSPKEKSLFLYLAGKSLYFREFSGEEILNSALKDAALGTEKKLEAKKMIKQNLEHHHPQGIPQALLKEYNIESKLSF